MVISIDTKVNILYDTLYRISIFYDLGILNLHSLFLRLSVYQNYYIKNVIFLNQKTKLKFRIEYSMILLTLNFI